MESNISKPTTAINPSECDFAVGDVVVYVSAINISTLEVVECYQPDNHYWLEGGQLIYVDQIRTATTAELKAHCRLPDPVALFVEDVA